MCTLVAIHRRNPSYPLIVAANRDEFYARAASSPRCVGDDPAIVAGVDRAKGGTWMGANERGLFVALTNQRQHGGADPARASRGEVVMDALAMESVEAIDDLLGSIDGREYNGFNLMYGDAGGLRVAYARIDRETIEVEALAPGVWVLPNDRIGSPDFPKTARARALAMAVAEQPWPAVRDGLQRLLADHERPPIDAVPPPPPGSVFTHQTLHAIQQLCVHTPVYGTKSATLLALSPGRVEHYLYAEGPPCQSSFEEVTELLR